LYKISKIIAEKNFTFFSLKNTYIKNYNFFLLQTIVHLLKSDLQRIPLLIRHNDETGARYY